MQQYRNSTNVDNEALLSIVRDAKVGSRTKRSKLFDNEYSPEYDQQVVDDASQWQSDGEAELSVQDSLPQASAASSSRDILCPICNRNLGHGDSTAQNTVMLDRHVERCARRGSRNVTNYALAGNESPDEEEVQRMPNSRSVKRIAPRSASNAGAASSSSTARASSASKATSSSSSSNGSALKIADGGNDEEMLDFSLFDEGNLGGSDWEGGRYSGDNNSSSSRGGNRSQQQHSSAGGGARSLRSTRSTRSNDNNATRTSQRSSARRNATNDDDESNSEAEFDAVNPVSKGSSSRNKAVKPVAKSSSKSSLNSTSIASDDDEDDDAQGFVASIVDDWEDAAYDHRLALVAEAYEQSKVKAHKRRKLEKAKKNQVEGPFVDSAFVDFTNAEGVPAPGQPLGSPADEGNDEDIGSEYIRTDYGTEMLRSTYQKLHQYQRDGCRWLHELYEEGVGGILGDEMGTLLSFCA